MNAGLRISGTVYLVVQQLRRTSEIRHDPVPGYVFVFAGMTHPERP